MLQSSIQMKLFQTGVLGQVNAHKIERWYVTDKEWSMQLEGYSHKPSWLQIVSFAKSILQSYTTPPIWIS